MLAIQIRQVSALHLSMIEDAAQKSTLAELRTDLLRTRYDILFSELVPCAEYCTFSDVNGDYDDRVLTPTSCDESPEVEVSISPITGGPKASSHGAGHWQAR